MHVYLTNLDGAAKERLPIYTKESVEVRHELRFLANLLMISSAVEQTGRGEQLEQQHLVQDGVVGRQGGAQVPVRRDRRHEEAGRQVPQARRGGANDQEGLARMRVRQCYVTLCR